MTKLFVPITILVLGGSAVLPGCGGEPAVREKSVAESLPADATGVVVEDLETGTGETAEKGDTVTVHYTGWLEDGTKFDSSLDRNQPFEFRLGAGQVIAGWEQGVQGMKEGGVRRLTIPPALAYGERGAGTVIPPNATLVFEVRLLDVK